MDSVKGKIAMMAGMAACCGTAMAVALGLLVITSAWIVGGVVVAVVAMCALFGIHFIGQRHDSESAGHSCAR